nr:thymidylate kinase isoform X1 [Megalopta genalis]
MSIPRGALIVFEGCDRAGKSTQVKMLVDALRKHNIPVERESFPNRTTPIGLMINDFLTKKQEYPPETMHLLFSANRWELKDKILRTLNSGTTLIIDRYAASGAAYTAATTKRNLAWCREPDRGLPDPDIVIFLDISDGTQRKRSNWGEERFENTNLQQSVASNYKKLVGSTWNVINADEEPSLIHTEILEKVLDTIHKAKYSPINELYNT